MATFHPLKAIDESFFRTANLIASATMEANCPPERLMETLAGDVVWTQWAPPLKHVEWTTAAPHGQFSKRTVTLAGGQQVKENFFIWKPNQQVAFYVEEGTIPGIEAFAENYDITVSNNGQTTHLKWTVAIQVTGIGAFFIPVSRFFMNLLFKRWLQNYKCILENMR